MTDHDHRRFPRRYQPTRQLRTGSKQFAFLALIFCGISIAASPSATAAHWTLEDGGNGHFYQVVRTGSTLSWASAREAAKLLGPGWDLATITSAEENAFVKGLFARNPDFFTNIRTGDPDIPGFRPGPWIGGFDVKDRNIFQWVTGEPVLFTNWGSSLPQSGPAIFYADHRFPWGDGGYVAWKTLSSPNPFFRPIAYIAEMAPPNLPGPPKLSSLTLNLDTVAGCRSVIGTVRISEQAPPEGLEIALSESFDSASSPATLHIPAGASSGTFTLKTSPVELRETGAVRATLGSSTVSQPLTVRPIGMMLLTLSRATVVGGYTVPGRAKLECRAAPGPINVDLESNHPALAAPVATSIVIPQGLQSESFEVTTHPALQTSSVSIKSTANGVVKATTLRLTAAATVSPKTLQFGDIVTGSTSPLHKVTLYNRGALSFAIIGIGFSGSFLPFFALGNDCPAQLAAGASCTIGIRMRPMVSGRRSATLSIATSATSSPLTVRVTGTGI